MSLDYNPYMSYGRAGHGKSCKGICDAYDEPHNIGQKKFENHRYCKNCTHYVPKDMIRCGCCRLKTRGKAKHRDRRSI